ncbi:hypothetical protein [Maribacter sp. 2308TA10-17]|uniref:hypothetical protein n=1 Tax=Maribacter sp. 2308TA10-17 TaxID=3386276 RepID=UPI0039BCD367
MKVPFKTNFNSQSNHLNSATFLCFLVGSFFILNACSSDDEPKVVTPEPIVADISVSAATNNITWTEANELTQKINDALTYNYSSATEIKTQKTLTFATDSTSVTATIQFKTAFQDYYNDPNASNNSVTITLEKQVVTGNAVILSADGPGDTYELITSVLAPNQNPVEVPDCNHMDFGRHIDEIFDTDLDANVFRFFIHTDPDNDRCINFDRQRNEIKTYDQSPDNLLGVESETVIYKWKFKLQDGFQSSPNFTHIHQLKSVGGDLDAMPMYTLTTRKSSPDRLELRYAETNSQVTLKQTDLAPLIGKWLEVTETITYGFSGTYSILIQQISDAAVLFEYANDNIINWRDGGTFVRPKWGIYRSLINAQDLRDEEVLYADFSIEEID